MPRMHRWLTVPVLVMVGCGSTPGRSAPSPATTPAVSAPERDDPHAIPDVDDRCYVIPGCGLQDDDGCPDVVIEFEKGESKLNSRARKLVGEVVMDMGIRKEVALLALIGTTVPGEPAQMGMARSNAVVALLIKRGVKASRLEARSDNKPAAAPPHVYFDLQCHNTTDRDEDGLSDIDDECPDEPEDKDGFEDTDGCPESDPPATCTYPDGTPCMSE